MNAYSRIYVINNSKFITAFKIHSVYEFIIQYSTFPSDARSRALTRNNTLLYLTADRYVKHNYT